MTLSLWGFAAYALLYLAVVTGTAMSSPWLRRRLPMAARSSGTHTILSLAGLSASAVHALRGVATPQGDQFAVLGLAGVGAPLALGVVGLYGMILSTVAVYARRRLAPRIWRAVHALAYPAFAAAAWHGIALGANTWLPAAQLLYAVTLASVAGVAAFRVAEMAVAAA